MRITDLNSLFTASLNNFLYIIDTNDTGSFLSGSSKKITVGDFISSSGVLGNGTASYALNSSASSYAFNANTSSYAFTSSYTLNSGTSLITGSTYPITSSWALKVISASISNTSSYISPTFISESAASSGFGTGGGGTSLITGSTYPITSSWSTYSLTASYYGGTIFSSSYSSNSTSASYAISASHTLIADTATNVSGGKVNATSITASNISASGYISASNFSGISATFSNITSSGPIYVSGSNAYIQLLPVGNIAIPTNLTASYIYTSGSTNDLYFTQYSGPYTNTTRLRWLESNLYTGILHGGVLTSTIGSTTFTVSAGEGIIVSMNAFTASVPYPTVKTVSWPTSTQPIINSGSAKITYVGIDDVGGIIQQTNAWGSSDINQWDTQITLGVVLHLSGSVSTGVFNSPQISYGSPQQADDFFRAFGPLKISGHVLQASGSSPTLSIKKSGGTAYREGVNYLSNPNHPSTAVENAINTSKIYRYYLSGSTPVIDTGISNAGYTTIDNDNYVDTTTGLLTTVGNSNWSIQRVFWIPNSPTNAFIVYYGNASYSTLLNAVNAKDTEPFTEAPNTALNSIFVGYIIIEGGVGKDLLNAAECTIIQGGLFRNVGGIGSSGTAPVSTTLAGLSDVALSGLTEGDLLVYGGGQWNNKKTLLGNYIVSGSLTVTSGITGNLTGTSSWASNAVTSSFALTASYINSSTSIITNLTASNISASGIVIANSFTGSFSGSIGTAISASYAVSASYAPTNTNITASWATNSVTSSFSISSSNALSSSYSLSSSNSVTSSFISPLFISQSAASYGFSSGGGSGSVFPYTGSANISGSLNLSGSQTITNNLTVNGYISASSFTGSLFGSSSFATSASYSLTASYALNGGSGGGSGFPYTGSADISGSLIVTGSVNAYSFTGSLFGNSTNGIPAGGLAGQYLVKNSGTDYDVVWATNESSQPIQAISYVADGTTNIFTVSSSYHDVNQLVVNINGIIQTPLRHYYINSSSFYDSVVLDQTPVSNSIVEIRTLQSSTTLSTVGYATTGSNTYYGTQEIQNGYLVLTQVSSSLNFANDAAAGAGGVPLGGIYRNGYLLQIRLS